MNVCSSFPQLKLESELAVTAPSMGRFGTTISSLADLNGDGLKDVAVGAPLQDDNRGAVYIYLGDRHRGIRSTFSQVRQRKPDTYLVLVLLYFGGNERKLADDEWSLCWDQAFRLYCLSKDVKCYVKYI